MKFAKVIETIFLFDRNESNVAARDNHTAGTAMQSTSQRRRTAKKHFSSEPSSFLGYVEICLFWMRIEVSLKKIRPRMR